MRSRSRGGAWRRLAAPAVLASALAACHGFAGAALPAPAPPLPGYQLVWHDEFDGPALDTASSPGEWGAFWMSSPTIGRPVGDPGAAGAEIDIAEHRVSDTAGADISDSYAMNVHWDGDGPDHKEAGGRGAPPPGAQPLQGRWHVYALRWTPRAYRFYLDGIEQWVTAAGLSQRPEFVKLTCEAQDASWAGHVPEGGYGPRGGAAATMQVDWVRVWQRAP